MSKLSHIFQSSRNHLFQKRLPGEDVKVSFLFASRACMSTAGQKFAADGKISDRVFANYSIFKGKAALSVAPALPTFSKLDSGDLRMDRCGVIMLTFRPAIGERKYDNEKKQLFALSATEVGSFISLGPNDTCEFFHDPSMLSSNAGQVRKSLSVKPLGDGNGYFISLNAIVYPLGCWFKRDSSLGDDTKLPGFQEHHRRGVVNNILNTNDRVTVPVTKAEFAVMREAFSFALPHIMGWAACTRQTWKRVEDNPSKVLPQRMDSEWDR